MQASELLRRYAAGERDFRFADLRNVSLRWAWLLEVNLDNANLEGVTFAGASMMAASLRWANLTRADLTRTDLRYADLSNATLRDAFLCDTDLGGAKTDYTIDLTRAYVSYAGLEAAYLAMKALKEAQKRRLRGVA